MRGLKAIGVPGSIGFLAFGCAVGLVLAVIGPRSRRAARLWLLVLYSSYVAAGIPRVGHAVAAGLPATPPLAVDAVRHAHMLVILGGDNGVGRLNEARRLLTHMRARTIVISGAPWMVDVLPEWKLPLGMVIHDARSSTTREQIEHLEPLIRRSSPGVVLIASRLQMPRVAALVRARQLDVLLAPAPIDIEPPTTGWKSYVPRYSGLRITRDALYEHAALFYYRRQGWID